MLLMIGRLVVVGSDGYLGQRSLGKKNREAGTDVFSICARNVMDVIFPPKKEK